MKNVLFLQITNRLGGIERFIINYVDHYDSSNFNIGVVTEYTDYATPDFWSDNNITVHLVPSRKHYFKYKKQLEDIISNYDIIHVNKNSLIDIAAIRIAGRLGKKIIVHSHNTSSSVKTKLLFLHQIHRGTVNAITDVKLACSEIAGQWMFGGSNFTLLPNGVDTEVFTIKETGLKKSLFGSDEVKVYGTVCRFTEQKNLSFLIDIFHELFMKDSNVRFVLVGDGPLTPKLKSKIKSLGLDDVCLFTGAVANSQDYYEAIDFVIAPSLYEGFPMSLVEAQSCGKYVFASDTITKEIKVTDAVYFVSLNKSAREWADFIDEKINGRTLIDRADIRNKFLLSPYNIKNTVNMLEKIYLEASEKE